MIMFGSMQNKKNELRIQFSIKDFHYNLLGFFRLSKSIYSNPYILISSFWGYF